MSTKGLVQTNDLAAVALSVAYETGMDYKKINTTMLMEKSAYQLGGNMIKPIMNSFLPKFLKNEGDILYYQSNQQHVASALLAGVYNYYGKNKSFKDSMMAAAVEGGSSFVGFELIKALRNNPAVKLADDTWL